MAYGPLSLSPNEAFWNTVGEGAIEAPKPSGQNGSFSRLAVVKLIMTPNKVEL